MKRVCSVERDGDRLRVRSPGVGVWRGHPAAGQVVVAGQTIGGLEVLGRVHPLELPPGAAGRIVELAGGGLAEVDVDFGAELMVLDPEGALGVAAEAAERATEPTGLVFVAPSSGRFYSRPAPDKPPFVSAGDRVSAGHTVCMLEVMKTFSRIAYGGPGLPDPARVVRVVPADEDDLEAGDVILELEAI